MLHLVTSVPQTHPLLLVCSCVFSGTMDVMLYDHNVVDLRETGKLSGDSSNDLLSRHRRLHSLAQYRH